MADNIHIGEKVYVQAGRFSGSTGVVVELDEDNMALIEFDVPRYGARSEWIQLDYLARLHS